ncbi:MAG: galactitol transporter subunit [Myxococcaceae bacterium]|nr:galactitol transporter subunit [Myxococcaceae bacterium]
MKKKILVACGTAVATSTVVAKKLEEKLRAKGIEVQIDQCKASEVSTKVDGYDVVVATTEVDDTRGKPFLRTLSFLTGIGVDADVEKIVKLLG